MRHKQPLAIHAKQRWQGVVVVVVALLHGAALLYLPLTSPADIYNSPDETANALLISNIRAQTSIRLVAPQRELPGSVAPRSLHRRNDTFIPVGFPAFPMLLGLAAKLVAVKGLPYVVALIGVFAVLAWYGFIRSIFGATVGFFSALLFALHPAILFWGSRPFMPQSPALYLAVFALYFLARALRLKHKRQASANEVTLEHPTLEQTQVKRRLASLFCGLCGGLAIVIRPPEMLWIGAMLVTMAVIAKFRRRLSLVLAAVGAGIPLLGAAALNALLYGGPLRTGYHLTPLEADAFQALTALITPFGFDGARTTETAWQYLVSFSPWIMALALAGAAAMWFRKTTTARRLKWWTGGALLLALYLLQLYGSFTVRDRLDIIPSLGTSFTRYFLPLYLVVTPLAAYGLRTLKFVRHGTALTSVVLLVSAALSVRLVFFTGDESILQIRRVLKENVKVREAALALVPAEGIILTERSDKIFFPHREVVASFRNLKREDLESLRTQSLYYETILSTEDVARENTTFWTQLGVRAVDPVDLGGRHTLYQLQKL